MSPTLTLHFVSVLLLLLMNGQNTRARDIKVESPDTKQVEVEWDKATPVSHDESQDDGGYTASYATQHNHHHGKHSHLSKTSDDDRKTDQPNYIASYRTKAHESNAPYIAAYKTTSAVHKSNDPYSGYAAAYGIKNRDSNLPYSASYRTTSATDKTSSPDTDVHKPNNPYSAYAAAYGIKSHDSSAPYIAAYRTTSATDKTSSPDTDVHKSNNPYSGYAAAYGIKSHDSDAPYIASYRTTTATDETSSPSTDVHNSKNPYSGYAAAYGIKNHDSNAPYIAAYRTRDVHKSNDPYSSYSAAYGIKSRDSNGNDPISIETHDSSPSYVNDANKIGPPEGSSSIDHTEAFKVGFFALDDLYVGNVMTLQFPIQEVSSFLPRKDVEAIPFSISQLSSVLQLFSIPEDSPKANAMRDTLGQCESEPITGETKTCATSLESMLEFVNTIIGSEVKHNILTTSSTTSNVPLQKYTILEISEDINAPNWVACHPLPYPYAVYYCHFIATGTKVFKVSLGGENDNKIEALGVCHLDTSDWDPTNFIFRQLGITAGKDPVCHFFPVNHLMWVPQPSQATM